MSYKLIFFHNTSAYHVAWLIQTDVMKKYKKIMLTYEII